MEKIKVLHILNTGVYSGAENVAISIIEKMQGIAEGVYLSKDGIIRSILKKKGIEFYAVKKLSVCELKRAICKIEPDIIHAHDFTAGIMAVLVANKIPIINHLHNNSPWLKKISWKSVIYGLACIRVNKILTVSNSILQEFIFAKYFLRKTKVIGNPFSIKDIQEKAMIADLEKESDIVFLGRCSQQKNPFFFLNIIASLVEVLPELRVFMIGDGELKEQIKLSIQKMNLSKNVILFGFLENPYGLLYKSKILCMPSSWEGFGLAAVEALSLGKPVVASPVGGLVDIINNTCGDLCNTKEEFVNEILHLLSDEAYYWEKSCGACQRVEKFNNIQKYMESLESLYISLSYRRDKKI